jgi:hypothetical protein
VSFLDAQPWPGYTARPLTPSGFIALRMLLRPRRRLQPSLFLVRVSFLTGPEELGYDGSLGSLVRLYREHPSSPWHWLSAATKRVYGPYANRWARVLAATASLT